MTNFTPDLTREIAARPAPVVMGNAQTHCIQLPNTLAFAHGALGRELTDQDFVDLAGGLLGKHGDAVFRAWKGFDTESADECLSLAGEMEELQDANLKVGELSGLLFGSPRRFVNDLVLQLRMRGTCLRLCESLNGGNDHPRRCASSCSPPISGKPNTATGTAGSGRSSTRALAKIGSPGDRPGARRRVGIGEGFTFVKSRYFREERTHSSSSRPLKRAVIGARFLDRGERRPMRKGVIALATLAVATTLSSCASTATVNWGDEPWADERGIYTFVLSTYRAPWGNKDWTLDQWKSYIRFLAFIGLNHFQAMRAPWSERAAETPMEEEMEALWHDVFAHARSRGCARR